MKITDWIGIALIAIGLALTALDLFGRHQADVAIESFTIHEAAPPGRGESSI